MNPQSAIRNPQLKGWLSWARLAGLGVTVGLLALVFQRIDFAALRAALRQTDLLWFAPGFVAYGVALGCGGLRSHLALRVTDRAIHFLASCRTFLVAHFFFVALFGAIGADLAKAAVYARWYRWGLPEVLAAAPLERCLGLGGTVVLAGIVLPLAFVSGGFDHGPVLEAHWPGAWGAAGLALVAVCGLGVLLWRPEGEGSLARTLRALRLGAGRLALAPRTALPGLLISCLAQAALSAVFAFNLRAVVHAPLAWAELAWTFPAITIISCLPFTVAGAGAREIAAITLLGLYGIPPGECVAASWLTLIQKLAWAAVGAGVLWREEIFFAPRAGRPLPRTISVVIPTLNEAAALPETVRRARAVPEVCEILVVDGGSGDATRELAAALGCRVLSHPAGRGGQLRLGAGQAVGDVVLLLHADTWLPPHAGGAVLNCLRDERVVAGGFWKRFQQTPLLLLGARWKCAGRLLLWGRIVGDQGLFVRREVLSQIGGVPDVPLMEEFELCRRLRRVGRLTLAEATVLTSARRFAKLGVLRTSLRMWRIYTLYRLGWPPEELRKIYEK